MPLNGNRLAETCEVLATETRRTL